MPSRFENEHRQNHVEHEVLQRARPNARVKADDAYGLAGDEATDDAGDGDIQFQQASQQRRGDGDRHQRQALLDNGEDHGFEVAMTSAYSARTPGSGCRSAMLWDSPPASITRMCSRVRRRGSATPQEWAMMPTP